MVIEAAELIVAQAAREGGVSMGIGAKANLGPAVGLLEHLQRRVALEPFSERGSSFGTEVVVLQTASAGRRQRC